MELAYSIQRQTPPYSPHGSRSYQRASQCWRATTRAGRTSVCLNPPWSSFPGSMDCPDSAPPTSKRHSSGLDAFLRTSYCQSSPHLLFFWQKGFQILKDSFSLLKFAFNSLCLPLVQVWDPGGQEEGE